MTMKLSRYHAVTRPFFDKSDQQPKRIVFATRTAEIRLIDDGSWQHVTSGAIDLVPTELLTDLISVELLVPADEDELATVLSRNNAITRDDDILALVIQPTASCQLSCDYCGQEHTSKWLNAEHQEIFLERTQSKLALKRFRHLDIRWFGAEPLSGIAVMRTLTPRLKTLAVDSDCTYSASIVTNGLALTDKIATELVQEHCVREITVTLDGIAEFHDARRPRKNGQASFDQIFANVVALAQRRDLEVDIVIRSNVDRRNYTGVSPLLRKLAAAGIQRRIKYYVEPIHSWGNDAHTLSLPSQEFATREIDWFGEMIQLGFSVMLVPSLHPVVCLAVMPHGELIDATGTLFNCTEVSYVPQYGTPNKFAIGHVAGGELPQKRQLLGDFNTRVERGEYLCSSCRMLPVCGGACPKAWLEGHEPCPSTKYNIEERLLLSHIVSRLAEEPGVSHGAEGNA